MTERTPRDIALGLTQNLGESVADVARALSDMRNETARHGGIRRTERMAALVAAGASDETLDAVRDLLEEIDDMLEDAERDLGRVESDVSDLVDETELALSGITEDVVGAIDDLSAIVDQPDRLADYVGPSDLAMFGPTEAVLRHLSRVIAEPTF